MGEKEDDDKNEDCSQSGRERRARTALFIDERLRRTATYGKAAADSRDEI